MKYFLGVDGGATKTEAIIIDEQEKVLAQALGGPVNYHQGGEEETRKNLQETIEDALSQVKLKTEEINSAVLGLAGRDTKEDEVILDKMGASLFNSEIAGRVKVVSDVEIAFNSCISKNYGIVMIAGTGANCFGKGKTGQVAWAGDWGWLIGDQSSGFALGLGALKRIMRDFDGRGEKTILKDLILGSLNLSRADELPRWIYREKIPIKEIAALAPLVFAAFKKGDKVAKELINKTVSETYLSISTVAKKTDLVKEEFEIGLVGGIFNEPLMIKLLEEKIKESLPKAKLILCQMRPAMAAAKMAKQINL